MDKQFITLKGIGHPTSMVNRLSDVAIESLESFNQKNGYDIYGDFSSSYLKGGKFPVFTVGGYMPFDFRDYSKELRYDIFNHIKHGIVGEFKSIFPDPTIDIQFNLNLEPSNIKYFLEADLHVESSSIYVPNTFNVMEQEVLDLNNHIRTLTYVGKDYEIRVQDAYLIIYQTFKNADEEAVEMYVNEVRSYIENTAMLSQLHLIINNDFYKKGNINWSRFGSTIFHNGSATTGSGNDWFGFSSSVRPRLDLPYGKANVHPVRYYLENTKKEYINRDDIDGYIINATVAEPLGDYNTILIKSLNS